MDLTVCSGIMAVSTLEGMRQSACLLETAHQGYFPQWLVGKFQEKPGTPLHLDVGNENSGSNVDEFLHAPAKGALAHVQRSGYLCNAVFACSDCFFRSFSDIINSKLLCHFNKF